MLLNLMTILIMIGMVAFPIWFFRAHRNPKSGLNKFRENYAERQYGKMLGGTAQYGRMFEEALSKETAENDPEYWNRRRAYNEAVGLAAPQGATPQAPNLDISTRLANLEAAFQAGRMSQNEYAAARAAIIASA